MKIKKSAFEPLDQYEKELMKAIDNDEFVEIPNQQEEIKRYTSYFRKMNKKNKRITIRVPQDDLQKIQTKAVETGIPYQTLIASVLHQFAKGKVSLGL